MNTPDLFTKNCQVSVPIDIPGDTGSALTANSQHPIWQGQALKKGWSGLLPTRI